MLTWNSLFLHGPKKLTTAQRKIIDYILENTEEAAYMSSAKLGQLLGVSNATVVRLSQALGFDGYPAMQQYIREELKSQLNSVQRLQKSTASVESVGDVLASVLQSDWASLDIATRAIPPDLFEKVVRVIHKQKEISVLGLRSSHSLAHFFATNISFLGKKTFLIKPDTGCLWEGIYNNIQTATETPLLMAFTFPRYLQQVIEIVKFYKNSGATIIGITANGVSPLSEYSDYVFSLPFWIDSYFESFVAAMSLLNAILAAISFLGGQETLNHLEKLEKIWDERGIYLLDSKGIRPTWTKSRDGNPQVGKNDP